MATEEVGVMHFLLSYTSNLSYIFIQKNRIFLYNICQKWLDTLLLKYSASPIMDLTF